jgi:hypothetical protein
MNSLSYLKRLKHCNCNNSRLDQGTEFNRCRLQAILTDIQMDYF